MSDLDSVVASLGETSKGRLKYSTSWTHVQASPPPVLNVPLYKIRTAPANKTKDCSNYFSPERKKNASINRAWRAKDDSPEKSYKLSPSSKKLPPNVKGLSEKIVTDTLDSRPTSSKKTSTSCINTSLSSILNASTQEAEAAIEREYQCMLERMVQLRVSKMNTKMESLDRQLECDLNDIQDGLIKKSEYHSHKLRVEEQEINQTTQQELEEYKRAKVERDKLVDQNHRQAEEQKNRMEDALRRKEQAKREIKQQKMKLAAYIEPATQIEKSTAKLVAEIADSPQLASLRAQVSQLYIKLTEIVSQGVNGGSSNLDFSISESENISSRLTQVLREMEAEKQTIISKQQAQKEEEAKKQKALEEEAKRKAAAAAIPATPKITPATPITATPVSTKSTLKKSHPSLNVNISAVLPRLAPLENILKSDLSQFSEPGGFKEYLQLQQLKAQVEKQCEPLDKATTKDKKTYKFDLYKVVNTTINVISDESSKHLLDKLLKLFKFFNGEPVTIGNKSVTVQSDANALLFCKNLLAKKLVQQGPSQVASSHNAAFPISAVAVGIWTLFPDCGQLLLAHIHANCPFLAPFYIPCVKGMDAVEYHRMLGYAVDGDNKVEEEEKFLKKLSGYVRLYAAIIQQEVPPQLGDRKHPHGVEHAWAWLTRFVSLEPRPAVTATILFNFLEVVGAALLKRFNAQFKKLLSVIIQEFMPKIDAVTTSEAKPATLRLKMFLEACVKEGRIKEPEGCLTAQWWARH